MRRLLEPTPYESELARIQKQLTSRTPSDVRKMETDRARQLIEGLGPSRSIWTSLGAPEIS